MKNIMRMRLINFLILTCFSVDEEEQSSIEPAVNLHDFDFSFTG